MTRLPPARASTVWTAIAQAAGVRAAALLNGRLAPSAEDVAALAGPVLSHRMALSFAARARGENLPALIGTVIRDTLRQDAA